MRRFGALVVLFALLQATTRSGSGQNVPIPPPAPDVPIPPPPAPNSLPAPALPAARRDLTPEEYRAAEASGPGCCFVTFSRPLDLVAIAGLPPGSRPEVLNWERVYQLALIHTHAEPPRFESLEPGRLAEQARGLGLDDFARFRADFASARAFRDPAADFLSLQAQLSQIETAQWNLTLAEHWNRLFKELIQGEASGLGLIDLDRSSAFVVEARRALDRAIADYRDRLDLLKVALGLAPQAAVTVDPVPLMPFRWVFAAMDRWDFNPRRDMSDLDRIVNGLPATGDFLIEGRAVLAEVEAKPDRLAELLAMATRVALAHRRVGDEPADAVELRVRHRLRHLIETRLDYLAEMLSTVLAIRLLDTTFEQIIAPPSNPVSRQPGQATIGFLGIAQQLAGNRLRLVTLWTRFQAERLAFERDLGPLPDADWPSYFGRFVAPAGLPIPAQPADLVRPDPILPPPPAGP